MRKQIWLLVLGTVFSLSTFAKGKTLPAKDMQIKKEILEKLDNGFDDVSTDAGVKRWKDAARISAQYEDTEILNKMLDKVRTSDGGPAEALPPHLFKVYEKNPIFYLKTALARNGGRMDLIAGEFLNEASGARPEQVEAPLKGIDPKRPGFELVKKLRQAIKEAEQK